MTTSSPTGPEPQHLLLEAPVADDVPPAASLPRARKPRWSALSINLRDELPAEQRAEDRRASRRVFRLYCVSCGRSTEGPIAPTGRPGRCPVCGGTMLLELTPD
jgi:hypothetical protein